MKRVVLAAVAVLAFSSTAALAGEGNGEPFDFHVPGLSRATAPSQNAGTRVLPRSGEQSGPGALVQPASSEAGVQTANSLPPDFSPQPVAQPQPDLAATARRAAAMHLADEKLRNGANRS